MVHLRAAFAVVPLRISRGEHQPRRCGRRRTSGTRRPAAARNRRKQFSGFEPSRPTWRFDDANRLLVLGVEGDWEGGATEGHTQLSFGAGFPHPVEMKRPKDQPQDAPRPNDYPAFTCYATTIKIPAAGTGFHWLFWSRPMDRELGGISYWRIPTFDGTTARM